MKYFIGAILTFTALAAAGRIRHLKREVAILNQILDNNNSFDLPPLPRIPHGSKVFERVNWEPKKKRSQRIQTETGSC